MSKELLIMNVKEGTNGPSWDFIPDDLWRYVIRGFVTKYCDSFSLDCLDNRLKISSIAPFKDFQPEFNGNKQYAPFHLPDREKDNSNYQHSQPAFVFNPYVASLLMEVNFGCWNAANDNTPADELVFWQGDIEKVLAIPYEGMIYFSNLTLEERDTLLSLDPRIKPNLRGVA